jgi:TIR domain
MGNIIFYIIAVVVIVIVIRAFFLKPGDTDRAKDPGSKKGSYNDSSAPNDYIPEDEPENNIPADEVYCTAFSPAEINAGSEFLIQIFAHTEKESGLLQALAEGEGDITELPGNALLDEKITRGSLLQFQLILGNNNIQEVLTTKWFGKLKHLQFVVLIPKNEQEDLIGKIVISLNSVPIGRLSFKITVLKKYEKKFTEELTQVVMKRFNQAFISYASPDRAEVLKRVQAMELMKLKYFQDQLTPEPGEEWEKKICEYLKLSDVVFLFWSKAASESEWVKKEIIYALKIKEDSKDSRPEIIPVIIEGPPPAKPPAELKSLHFSDKMIYFINRDRMLKN